MLTPNPFDLGLVAMGNNQVAFDAVCCHIIGVDPMSVDHIRMAHERGFGPVNLAEIQIIGDLSLDEAKKGRGQGFQVGLIHLIEDYFEGTKIKAYEGRPRPMVAMNTAGRLQARSKKRLKYCGCTTYKPTISCHRCTSYLGVMTSRFNRPQVRKLSSLGIVRNIRASSAMSSSSLITT